MRQYRLLVTMYQPNEDTEFKYMAEVPILPGCRAWGDSPAEALETLQSVASEFIRSYQEHKDPLPQGLEEITLELVGAKTATEVTVVI